MISEEHIKENLSRAYVQAIAAKAGINIEIDGRSQDYGFDGTFHQVNLIRGKLVDSGVSIDFQLKASINFTIETDSISYALDSGNYNSLAYRASTPRATPAVLVLLTLPKDTREWINLDEQQLILKNCCYWEVVSSKFTQNTSSKTIKIPRRQLLTPESLQKILQSVELNGNIISDED
ncbi:MAG: hypothetical protein CMO81_03230 [Waddliaceae bacterium]|nr:hypothetical protein [Waddliaceae bacterium]